MSAFWTLEYILHRVRMFCDDYSKQRLFLMYIWTCEDCFMTDGVNLFFIKITLMPICTLKATVTIAPVHISSEEVPSEHDSYVRECSMQKCMSSVTMANMSLQLYELSSSGFLSSFLSF